MYDSGDILLFALSARRKTSWREFKMFFEEAHRRTIASRASGLPESAARYRWPVLRSLACLGHIEVLFTANDIQVVAAPSTLALLPTLRSYEAILCGARSPGIVDRLSLVADRFGVEVSVSSQEAASPYAPTRVGIRAGTRECIKAVAEHIGIHYMDAPPSYLLASISISLQNYIEGLTWSGHRELNWRREDFDIGELRFSQMGETSLPYRLSRYQDPVRSVWRYQLWRDGKSLDIDLDWGRHAVLALSSQRVLKYDYESRNALVPYGAPLPVLLARALGLCSGEYPEMVQCTKASGYVRYFSYKRVPPSVFEAVSRKVEEYGR